MSFVVLFVVQQRKTILGVVLYDCFAYTNIHLNTQIVIIKIDQTCSLYLDIDGVIIYIKETKNKDESNNEIKDEALNKNIIQFTECSSIKNNINKYLCCCCYQSNSNKKAVPIKFMSITINNDKIAMLSNNIMLCYKRPFCKRIIMGEFTKIGNICGNIITYENGNGDSVVFMQHNDLPYMTLEYIHIRKENG